MAPWSDVVTIDPVLLDALETLPGVHWQGHAWRHMFNDYPPERANDQGARWNPRGVAAIYTALDRATALAEGQHAIDVQPRRIYRRRVLYELAVDVPDVLDLSEQAALASVGLTLADVSSDNFTACQRIGGAIAWLGRGGFIVPSARSSGANLVVLIESGGVELERVKSEEVVDDRAGSEVAADQRSGLEGPPPDPRRDR